MGAYNIVNQSNLIAGQPEDVSVVLANLQAIQAILNGGIDNSNVSAAAAIAASKLSGYPTDATKFLRGDGAWTTPSGVPTGAIEMFAAAAAPSGWALCDGSSVLRSGAGYDALFAVIGTVYGSVDGTHFTLPDLRGRVAVGFAASGGHADVSTLSNNDGVAVANRRPKHRTSLTDPGHFHQYIQPAAAALIANINGTGTGGQYANTDTKVTGITVGTGNANDSLDAPAYVVVNFIIKL